MIPTATLFPALLRSANTPPPSVTLTRTRALRKICKARRRISIIRGDSNSKGGGGDRKGNVDDADTDNSTERMLAGEYTARYSQQSNSLADLPINLFCFTKWVPPQSQVQYPQPVNSNAASSTECWNFCPLLIARIVRSSLCLLYTVVRQELPPSKCKQFIASAAAGTLAPLEVRAAFFCLQMWVRNGEGAHISSMSPEHVLGGNVGNHSGGGGEREEGAE